MAIGRGNFGGTGAWRRRLWFGLLLVLWPLAAAPAAAERAVELAVELDEAEVERLVEACAAADAAALHAARLERHGLAPLAGAPEPGLKRAVERALAPELNPERARAELARTVAERGGEPAARRAIQVLALEGFAFYEALNCTALRQWFGHLVVYRDLHAKSAPGDPKRGYLARSVESFRGKLALTLQARRRLAEKERALLPLVGLAGE